MEAVATSCARHGNLAQQLACGQLSDGEAVRVEGELLACPVCRAVVLGAPENAEVLLGVVAGVAAFRSPRAVVRQTLLPLAAGLVLAFAGGTFWMLSGQVNEPPERMALRVVPAVQESNVAPEATRPASPAGVPERSAAVASQPVVRRSQAAVTAPAERAEAGDAPAERSGPGQLFADDLEDGSLSGWVVCQGSPEEAGARGTVVQS